MMNHIELFAGCGGLTLGLEQQGFELLLANELSPMASETFAYNILGVDLSSPAGQCHERVLWLSSAHSRDDLPSRLRENPCEAAGIDGRFSDLDDIRNFGQALRRTLLVGSIVDLVRLLRSNADLEKSIRGGLGDGEIDLVSGGPPCQSFSMAGARDHTNSRNQLPWQFAEFVKRTSPRMVLLENVTGILRPFSVSGEAYYAWFEVCKAFSVFGYVPVCLHVNAKYVGAAQNRPRFIMMAFRGDVFDSIRTEISDASVLQVFEESARFHAIVQSGRMPVLGDLSCYDVEDRHNRLFESEIFAPLVMYRGSKLVSVKEAIDDLRDNGGKPSKYVRYLNSRAFGKKRIAALTNRENRCNSYRVRARFRVFQVISKLEELGQKEAANQVARYLRSGDRNELSNATLDQLLDFKFLRKQGQLATYASRRGVLSHLSTLQTRKQTQKALVAEMPAPAALSIPDDACHYHDNEQRTLSVREMARIQSFPDWFIFRSKVTTGGQMRKFEVPQYTQVGNAVPPLLGLALGQVCKTLLEIANQAHADKRLAI